VVDDPVAEGIESILLAIPSVDLQYCGSIGMAADLADGR